MKPSEVLMAAPFFMVGTMLLMAAMCGMVMFLNGRWREHNDTWSMVFFSLIIAAPLFAVGLYILGY